MSFHLKCFHCLKGAPYCIIIISFIKTYLYSQLTSSNPIKVIFCPIVYRYAFSDLLFVSEIMMGPRMKRKNR